MYNRKLQPNGLPGGILHGCRILLSWVQDPALELRLACAGSQYICLVQVQRSNALRYILMHAFGGLYLELEVECFSTVEETLGQDNTIVLQGAGPAGITNAAMASTANSSFWLEVLHLP